MLTAFPIGVKFNTAGVLKWGKKTSRLAVNKGSYQQQGAAC